MDSSNNEGCVIWKDLAKMSDSAGITEESLASALTPKEEMEEKHKELAVDMFQKITEYLNGELAGETTVT